MSTLLDTARAAPPAEAPKPAPAGEASEFIARYAALATPRYTSYPPATAFHAGVGEADRRAWIAALPAGSRLSLYVHIPFCASLCWYCGCHMTVVNRPEPVERHLAALMREIDAIGAVVPEECAVARVHFGGGTPNSLTPEQFERLIGHLRASFDFAPDAEIASELDPRTLTPAHIEALGRAGLTRASLGVQDVSEDVQRLIQRIQPFEQVEAAASGLRAAGVASVNLDLLYGLPGQTVAHVRRSAEAAISVKPDRLAVFGYAHVPWFKKHQRAIDASKLPGGAERLAQADAAAATLMAAGYERIGFDHFALPHDALAEAARAGALRRNFQGYTEDDCCALLGLGASAVTATPSGFCQNQPHIGAYEETLMAPRMTGADTREQDAPAGPTVRGLGLTLTDRLIGAAIERLLCDFTVDLEAVAAAHDFEPAVFDGALERAQAIARDGLVSIEGRRLSVTARGRPYARVAAAQLDPDWSPEPTKHSVSV
ncbi:MAG: oxygen-independent coproporphyrinogen III oxidase [Pseudomonadota bacterium]